ncbi:MAG: hypothetical protein O7J95_13290 [Planctomycetota bacterium]|nr:hypothetical protein [Planctomycetota bacterium]
MTHLRTVSFTAAALIPLALCGGCKSLEHIFDWEDPLRMYGGTRNSVAYIDDKTSTVFGRIWHLVDLPATAVFDTVIFPIALPVELSRGDD